MTDDEYNITNELCDCNQPYSMLSRIMDIVFNFLTADGVIAAAGIAGYIWARYI